MSLFDLITDNKEYIGIDMVRIRFPIQVESGAHSSDFLNQKGVRKTLKNGIELSYAKGELLKETRACIKVEVINNGFTAILEFNPSRVMDLIGSTLCHPNDLTLTIIWAIRECNQIFLPLWAIDTEGQLETNPNYGSFILNPSEWPKGWEKHVQLLRLDLARDFYVDIPGFDMNVVAQIKKNYARHDYLYRKDLNVQTISWGKSSNVRHSFYNKSDCPTHKVPKGWYRYEIQFRTKKLKDLRLDTLDKFQTDTCFNFLLEKWEQSNLGNDIAIGYEYRTLLDAMKSQMSATKFTTLLGLHTALEMGIELGMHKRLINEYRKLGSSFGFVLGTPLEKLGTDIYHLDFYTGSLIKSDDVSLNKELLSLVGHPAI